MSGVMILPLLVSFSVGSSSSGIIISRLGKYNAILRTGYVLWTAGAGGRISLHRTSPIPVMVVSQIIEGIGTGFCFQPGMRPLFRCEIDGCSQPSSNDRIIGKFPQGGPRCSYRASKLFEDCWWRNWLSWYRPL